MLLGELCNVSRSSLIKIDILNENACKLPFLRDFQECTDRALFSFPCVLFVFAFSHIASPDILVQCYIKIFNVVILH